MPQHPEMPSLTQRAGSAVGFRLGGNVATVALGLGLGVILARLLPPREFGVFGVGLAIVAMAEILSACGMLQALVQRRTVGPEEEAAAAAVQMGGALLLGGGLVLAGPAVENFFGMPGLAPLVQLQAAVPVINAVGLVPTSRLTRRLAFGRLAGIDVSTRTLGGITSILLALQGMGALALAIGSVTAWACRTCLVWIFAPGRFPLTFRMHAAKNLLGYGTGILLIRVCNDFAQRVDVLILGHRLGAGVVGLYQRAFQLVRMPLYQFTSAVNQVLFPAMASVQDADHRFRRGYLGAVGLTAMLAFPILTLLWTTAEFLIPLLYGPMWTDTAPILVSLGFVGYLRILNNPNGLVTQARGRVMQEAARQGLFMAFTALFVFFGTFFGVQGVVIGIGTASLIFLVMMTRLALSISGVKFFEWLGALRTPVVSSVAMALAVLGSKAILVSYMPIAVVLVAATCTGILVYILSLRVLLTQEQRQILGRISTILPARLSRLFHVCIGSVRDPVPSEVARWLRTEKPTPGTR